MEAKRSVVFQQRLVVYCVVFCSRYPRLPSITYAVSRAARHQIDPAAYITPDQSSQLLDRARP